MDLIVMIKKNYLFIDITCIVIMVEALIFIVGLCLCSNISTTPKICRHGYCNNYNVNLLYFSCEI